MLTRRGFANCAICAATAGLVASAVQAQTPTQTQATRTILRTTDLPDGDQYVVLLATLDVPPNILVPRHTHPGVESTYVAEGGRELSVKASQIAH